MMQPTSYDLPDYAILHSDKSTDYSVWKPRELHVVLGRSNRVIEDSVYIEKIKKDGVKIHKRPSGGEAVVLSPKMLVISVKFSIENSLKTHQYFRLINEAIIKSLTAVGVKDVKQKGISDIAIGAKKILGSSIYKTENTIFYHAVLNIAEPVSTISRYLKHPSREPDYRFGRAHDEFVTSLEKEGYRITPEELEIVLQHTVNKVIKTFPK